MLKHLINWRTLSLKEQRTRFEKCCLLLCCIDVAMVLFVALLYRCSNGYLSAYVRGQDITKELPDEVFCGRTLPDPLVTSNPRLLLLFNTSNARLTGHGFKARFQFVTGSSFLVFQISAWSLIDWECVSYRFIRVSFESWVFLTVGSHFLIS